MKKSTIRQANYQVGSADIVGADSVPHNFSTAGKTKKITIWEGLEIIINAFPLQSPPKA